MTSFRVTGHVGQHELYTAITGLLYDLYYLAPDETLRAERTALIAAMSVVVGLLDR